MAKGVEDTAFYRWTHDIGLCEVGGEPAKFGVSPEEFHAWATRAQWQTPVGDDDAQHPRHQARRGHPRAPRRPQRAAARSGRGWSTTCARPPAPTAPTLVDGRTENILWQTLAGTWSDDGPIAAERLEQYLLKAMREAKSHTRWTAPDEAYEAAVVDLATRA